jgi:hypothetical protein
MQDPFEREPLWQEPEAEHRLAALLTRLERTDPPLAAALRQMRDDANDGRREHGELDLFRRQWAAAVFGYQRTPGNRQEPKLRAFARAFGWPPADAEDPARQRFSRVAAAEQRSRQWAELMAPPAPPLSAREVEEMCAEMRGVWTEFERTFGFEPEVEVDPKSLNVLARKNRLHPVHLEDPEVQAVHPEGWVTLSGTIAEVIEDLRAANARSAKDLPTAEAQLEAAQRTYVHLVGSRVPQRAVSAAAGEVLEAVRPTWLRSEIGAVEVNGPRTAEQALELLALWSGVRSAKRMRRILADDRLVLLGEAQAQREWAARERGQLEHLIPEPRTETSEDGAELSFPERRARELEAIAGSLDTLPAERRGSLERDPRRVRRNRPQPRSTAKA